MHATVRGKMPEAEGKHRSATPKCMEVAVAACEECRELVDASDRLRELYASQLSMAKTVFLEEVLLHNSGDDLWLRVLQALGE